MPFLSASSLKEFPLLIGGSGGMYTTTTCSPSPSSASSVFSPKAACPISAILILYSLCCPHDSPLSFLPYGPHDQAGIASMSVTTSITVGLRATRASSRAGFKPSGVSTRMPTHPMSLAIRAKSVSPKE